MPTGTRRPKIKQTKHLTLRDRLSRLTYVRACQLLGPQGAQLIREGSNFEIDVERDVYLRGDLFRVKFPHLRWRQEPRGHDHHHGRRQQPPEIQLHGLRNDVRACRGRRVAGPGRKDRAGTGRPARRKPPAGTPQRKRACRTRPRRTTGAGQVREIPRQVLRRQQALGRLHGGQRPVGQDLSRGPAGRRAGAVVLLVSRLPHQYPRHVQARPAPAGPRAAAIPRGRAAEAVSQPGNHGPRTVWGRDDPAPAASRQGR